MSVDSRRHPMTPEVVAEARTLHPASLRDIVQNFLQPDIAAVLERGAEHRVMVGIEHSRFARQFGAFERIGGVEPVAWWQHRYAGLRRHHRDFLLFELS